MPREVPGRARRASKCSFLYCLFQYLIFWTVIQLLIKRRPYWCAAGSLALRNATNIRGRQKLFPPTEQKDQFQCCSLTNRIGKKGIIYEDHSCHVLGDRVC